MNSKNVSAHNAHTQETNTCTHACITCTHFMHEQKHIHTHIHTCKPANMQTRTHTKANSLFISVSFSVSLSLSASFSFHKDSTAFFSHHWIKPHAHAHPHEVNWFSKAKTGYSQFSTADAAAPFDRKTALS